jgi:hypothetical protein
MFCYRAGYANHATTVWINDRSIDDLQLGLPKTSHQLRDYRSERSMPR